MEWVEGASQGRRGGSAEGALQEGCGPASGEEPLPSPAVAEGPASGAASCGTSKAAVGFGGWLGEEGARGAVPARPRAELEDQEPGREGPRSQAEKSQLGSGRPQEREASLPTLTHPGGQAHQRLGFSFL